MNRTPPAEVLFQLRSEVGFVCPVEDCCSPFLTWHHFDPPWRVENHHDPKRMIALCREHHDHAEGGAFTIAQLRSLKEMGDQGKLVSSKMKWMRNRLLLIAGGSFYYETLTVFEYNSQKVIWLERDKDDNLSLCLRMLSTCQEPRAFMDNNQWYSTGNEKDIVCPPFGRKILIEYHNGDSFGVEFFEASSLTDISSRFALPALGERVLPLPVTCVCVSTKIGGTPYGFTARETSLPGIRMKGGFMGYQRCAISM